MSKIKIIYIVGIGRSGSTILDLIIGNNDGCLSCGEITNIFKDAFIKNQICSCGQVAINCDYWQSIKKEWLSRNSLDVEEFITLIYRYEKNGIVPWLRYYFNRFLFKTRDFRLYLQGTNKFINLMSTINNKYIIIDSSKRVLRFKVLQSHCGFDVFPIHLIRDLKGIMASEVSNIESTIQKQVIFLKTIIRYVVVNMQIKFVLSNVPHKTLLYESLLENPQEELNEIGKLCQINTSESIGKIVNQEVMNFRHLISGSHIRTQSNIILQKNPSEKWKKYLPKFYATVADSITKIIRR